jgi:hypothetical protein
MNLAAKAKELIQTAPFSVALHACSSASAIAASLRTAHAPSQTTGNFNVEDINALVRISGQVFEIGNRL